MSLYKLANKSLNSIDKVTYEALGIRERQDIQKFLVQDISIIDESLFVLCEEYSDWEDSRRRVDILCINNSNDLVVVELKRTEDGGHMELQAVRYAAMLSSMTFSQAVAAHAKWGKLDPETARSRIIEFLDYDSKDDLQLSGDVKIVLVSADFSKEVTTTVLWLNQKLLDVRCVKLTPYDSGLDIIVNCEQIIPILEASEYITKIKDRVIERASKIRQKVEEGNDYSRRFWQALIKYCKSKKNDSMEFTDKTAYSSKTYIRSNAFTGPITLGAKLVKDMIIVQIYIQATPSNPEKNKLYFHKIEEHKADIESDLNKKNIDLIWLLNEDKVASHIDCINKDFNRYMPESDWEQAFAWIASTTNAMHLAFKKTVDSLKIR